MFIQFIVVIVMILVIVGLMATGNTGGGTGINQTKATKVVTEIGTIAQSLSFYKTTTATGDMTGFTHADGVALLDGYTPDKEVPDNISYLVDGTAVTVDGHLADTNATDLIASQAETSVLYAFDGGGVKTDGTLDTNNTNKFVINVVSTSTDTDLVNTLTNTVKSKLDNGNMAVVGDAGAIEDKSVLLRVVVE